MNCLFQLPGFTTFCIWAELPLSEQKDDYLGNYYRIV